MSIVTAATATSHPAEANELKKHLHCLLVVVAAVAGMVCMPAVVIMYTSSNL
jgi:hypothetical protein